MEKISKIDTANTFKQPLNRKSSEEPPKGPSKTLHTHYDKILNKEYLGSTGHTNWSEIIHSIRQYIYIAPYTTYGATAPYVVYVQRIEVSPNDGYYLHPIFISLTLAIS